MSQERLQGLSLTLIETDICQKLIFDELINQFEELKSKKFPKRIVK